MKKFITCLTLFLFLTVCVNAQIGYLDVKSEPANSDIYINNVYKGKTPSIIELSPGRYKLKLEYNGYEPYVKQIEIADNLVLKEMAELKGYVKLDINTNPTGSVI